MRIRSRCPGAPSDDRGAVAIIVALFLVVFMILLAFVVDFGRAYTTKAQLQNSVDAAALAAAQSLCTLTKAQVEQIAVDYAALNQGVVASPVVADMTAKTINVKTTQSLPLIFGPFVNVRNVDVSAEAEAATTCGIIFSIFTEKQLTFNGTATDGYTLYYGGSFTYNGGGQPSTFAGIFHPGGGATAPNVTPGTATDVTALTAEEFYTLLQIANSTYLPTIQTIDSLYCYDVRIKGTNYPGKYGTQAQFESTLNTAGPALNCRLDGTYTTPVNMQRSLLTDGDLKITQVYVATPPTVTSPLIYSSLGSIIIDKVHAPFTVFYAGANTATIGESVANPTTVCTVIAQGDITYNGGRQQAGCVNPILLPGSATIGTALTK